MPKYRTLVAIIIFLGNSFAFGQDYSQVLFANSVLPGNYGYSLVSYSGFSWVENVKGKIPLIDTISFTPRNALSLKYTSSIRGSWESAIYFPENRSYKLRENDEVLSFRIYLMEGFDLQALPKIAVLQGDSCTDKITIQNSYTGQLLPGEWLHVRIPIRHFKGLNHGSSVSGIVFYQGGATGLEVVNQLLIDQIEFIPANLPETDLSYPAVLNSVRAYEKHVDVEWQLPLDPGIRYVKIYRSVDGKNFEAVAIRPILSSKYTDMVPVTNRTYYYKITWLDHRYLESPFSVVMSASAAPISNDALLDAVQAAHINYFDKLIEFNSGMHKVNFQDEDAVVNVEETGYSLLATTVGASNGLISNRLYLRRVSNIVDFLTQSAEQYYGVYPFMLDGRSGKGVFAQDTASFVSVQATAALMQGLIVARNYLRERLVMRGEEGNQAGNVEERLAATIKGIDELWSRVRWDEFAAGDTVLYDSWSPQTGFEYARPMGGFGGDLLSYVLALSSPTHAIGREAYEKGFGVRRTLIGRDSVDQHPVYLEEPFRTDTLIYGYYLDVGRINQNLLESYSPFLAFDPMDKRDQYADYGLSLTRLTQAYKRRDNEMNAGNVSSDIWGTAQNELEAAHLPVIVPAISASSFAYTPELAIRSIRRMYEDYGAVLFTEFGFRSWISIHDHQVSDSFRALNQAAIPVMIENGRSGLIWNLLMSHEDIDRTVRTYFHLDN